jgi:hypothetical protein
VKPSSRRIGPEVEAFEAEYASYCGTKHAIGISSGTDALALVLRAFDIGPRRRGARPRQLVHRDGRGTVERCLAAW